MEADGRKEKEIEKEKALNKRVCVCVFELYQFSSSTVMFIIFYCLKWNSRSHILPPSYIVRAYNGKW